MSINWRLDVDPKPALLVLPPAAASLDEADAAVELWEHYSKKRLDPAPRLTVYVMMAETAEGAWAARTTGREMPRQNGKGDEIEVVELWGLVQRSEAILHTVHDAVLLATQAQQRLLGVLESHGDLRRLVKRKWLGTGQQMIEMRNGGVIWYRTRTNGGGRGVDDVSRLVVDEAQHATPEHMAAVTPTLLANENPQMNVAGTAGIEGKSDWWWTVRKRALGRNPGAFGYVGHTAERVRLDASGRVEQEPVDVTDRSLWRASNPAIAANRGGGIAFLEEQFLVLGAQKFAQEHLCVWDPESGSDVGSVIPADAWVRCLDEASTMEGAPVFAVDVTPDRARTSIAAAGRRPDGLLHAEVVENRPGTAWAVGWLVERQRRWGGSVVLDATSPAGALEGVLTERGVPITVLSGRDYAQACGLFYDLIVEGRVRHRSEPLMDVALAGAAKKDTGDGGWTWSRRKSEVDITPLVAETLALAAASETGPSVYEERDLMVLG